MTANLETEQPADYLTRLADYEVGRSYKARVRDLLRIGAGHTVVDVGCGPGVDLPEFATATGTAGHVIGVDHDPAQLDQARRLTRGLRHVRVEMGDAAALPVTSGSADRVHTDRVLQHVDSPAAVLDEIRRVLRPDGRATLAEPDWDTLVIDHPDHRLPDTYRRYVVEHVVRNARIGRQLPRLAVAAGLHVEAVDPITTVFLDIAAADAVLGLGRVTTRAVDDGFLAPDDADVWLHDIRTGPFFAAVTMFATTIVNRRSA